MLDEVTAMSRSARNGATHHGRGARTSFTLPSQYYTSPAVFEREKEAIFYRTWQYVAHRSAFAEPGDYVTLPICDQNIFVIKGGDGVLRAFYNVCRHRGHELAERVPAATCASAIVCPYHAWTYEREGEVAREHASPRSGRVSTGPTSGCVRSGSSSSATASSSTLTTTRRPSRRLAGDMEADLRRRVPWLGELRMHSHPIDILGDARQHAGWKVVVDNYVECYHCRHAHPDFASLIAMDHYQLDVGQHLVAPVGAGDPTGQHRL